MQPFNTALGYLGPTERQTSPWFKGGTSYGAEGADAPQILMQWGNAPHFPMASLAIVQLKFGDQRICLLVDTVPTDNFILILITHEVGLM